MIQSGLVFGEISFGFGKTLEDISDIGVIEMEKVIRVISGVVSGGRVLTDVTG